MTTWAGYFLRRPNDVAPPALVRELRGALSRTTGSPVSTLDLGRLVVAQIDIDAYGAPSRRQDQRGLSVFAGDPCVRGHADVTTRAGIDWLHERWCESDFAATARAEGTFAALHYDVPSATLSLISDRIGVRPIYFAVTESVIIFGTALRIIEAITWLQKTLDLRGAIETIALGFPLADRTLYEHVHTVRDGEVVSFSDESVARRHYWRLSHVPLERWSIDEAAAEVRARFRDAVDRRLGSDRHTMAFLSGGLDSRCVVTELRDRGVEVRSFNFAADGTNDHFFGDAFAAAVGTIHERVPKLREQSVVHWTVMMAEALAGARTRGSAPPERPRIVWSGDGGSVGLGFVNVYPSVTALLRAGRRKDAADEYLRAHGVSFPARVFRRDVGHDVRSVLQDGVLDALDDVRHEAEPGREQYFFAMLNDQRRHLAVHFEDSDLHRLELALPFYDGALLEAIAATPPEYGMRHHLYHQVLELFPPVARSVAWQAYPGHERCPVPPPQSGIYQWGEQRRETNRQSRRRTILGEMARVLRARRFPALLNRPYLVAASVLHWLGAGDYGYAVDWANAFVDYWQVTEGRWAPPRSDSTVR